MTTQFETSTRSLLIGAGSGRAARAARSGTSRQFGIPRWLGALKITVVVMAVLFFIAPIIYLSIVSLKSPDDILSTRILPSRLAWENWASAFDSSPVWTQLRNSLLVAGIATLIGLIIAIPANYAMARLRVGGARLMTLIVSAYIAPPIVAVVPLFILARSTGLIDSIFGLALLEGLMICPVMVWLLDGFFRSIPAEVDEAAKIDGSGPVSTLLRIVLPLVAPGIVAVAIIAFILVYNDFLVPLMLAQSPGTQTLPIGISLLQGGREVMFGQMAAVSLTGMIPVYLLALVMQRWLIGGLTQGSVK